FSMMGFFPVTPGTTTYAIGSPFFEKATLNLPNGKTFTVRAKGLSQENKFIQKARLNGKELNKPWFTHEQLMEGGTLEFTMSPKPNKEWGSAPEAAPLTDLNN
ncbi:MAG: glycoside hydrolase family 92 protein, partial [Bacteroidaceae bacterium]|nr:glycoside hydrolase family 92 protein [Bacteroidaceae bacterium]